MADPGFPGMVRQLRADEKGGHQSIVWKNYCQKLHENEGNWIENGVGASLAPHLDPRLRKNIQYKDIKEKCIYWHWYMCDSKVLGFPRKENQSVPLPFAPYPVPTPSPNPSPDEGGITNSVLIPGFPRGGTDLK